jgi:hypothetical protein
MFSACEEEIQLELNNPDNQRIVVEGRVTNEFRHQLVKLTYTTSYFQNEPAPAITDAEAYIVEEGTGRRFNLTQSTDSLGLYETEEMAGRVGETYSLFINLNDELYKASSYLDTVLRLDSMKYKYEIYSYFGFTFGVYNILLSAFEPPPEGQIYKLDFYINDTLYTDELDESVYQSDFLINDTYLDTVSIYGIPQEYIKLDTNVIRLEVISISEEEVYFISELLNETLGNGSIFSGPPANIRTNVLNTSGGLDGLGFFGASSKTSIEMVLIKEHDESTNNPFIEENL